MLATASRTLAAVPAAAVPAVAPAADVRLVTLRNGMRLLLAPDSTANAVDVAVWYRAGTVHERAGITGISHLFEHLMFSGSEHYGPQEHNRLVQAEGGSANAYTSPDYACYHQTVPPGALELVLKLEADRIGSLKLTDEALETEKRVVREEKRWRAEALPIGGALEGLGRLAWPAHPYRWPVLGLDEDLARISLADCQAYYLDHYAPNNATVTIVGRFDPDQALQAAKRWLEPLKRRRVANDAARRSPRRRPSGAPSSARTCRSAWCSQVGGLPAARTRTAPRSACSPGSSSEGRPRACSAPSRRSRCAASRSRAPWTAGATAACSTCWPCCGPARTAPAWSVRWSIEVEKLAREPVGEEELERVRRQEEIGTLLAWQTVRGRAEALGSAQLAEGDWRAAALRFERVRQLAPADLQRAAARRARAGRAQRALARAGETARRGPGGERCWRARVRRPACRGRTLTMATTTRTLARTFVAALVAVLSAGPAGALAADLPAFRPPVPVIRTLPNGLRVAVFQDRRLPLVQMRLLLPAGVAQEAAETPGAASATAQLLRAGTSSRTAGAFAADVDFLGGSISGVAARDYSAVSGTFLAADFEAGLELLADAVVNPDLPARGGGALLLAVGGPAASPRARTPPRRRRTGSGPSRSRGIPTGAIRWARSSRWGNWTVRRSGCSTATSTAPTARSWRSPGTWTPSAPSPSRTTASATGRAGSATPPRPPVPVPPAAMRIQLVDRPGLARQRGAHRPRLSAALRPRRPAAAGGELPARRRRVLVAAHPGAAGGRRPVLRRAQQLHHPA